LTPFREDLTLEAASSSLDNVETFLRDNRIAVIADSVRLFAYLAHGSFKLRNNSVELEIDVSRQPVARHEYRAYRSLLNLEFFEHLQFPVLKIRILQ